MDRSKGHHVHSTVIGVAAAWFGLAILSAAVVAALNIVEMVTGLEMVRAAAWWLPVACVALMFVCLVFLAGYSVYLGIKAAGRRL